NAGHTLDEFGAFCDATAVWMPPPAAPPPTPKSLADLRAACLRWFGPTYDFDAMIAVVAAAAAERLGGGPGWVPLVSGSGATKTETVQTLTGAGALITSTISSKGALLSGSPKKDQSPGATGGLLRQLGDRGILVIKDFTSILAANVNLRGEVLAALREIH